MKHYIDLEKAVGTNLQKKVITNKAGHQQTVYVKVGEESKQERHGRQEFAKDKKKSTKQKEGSSSDKDLETKADEILSKYKRWCKENKKYSSDDDNLSEYLNKFHDKNYSSKLDAIVKQKHQGKYFSSKTSMSETNKKETEKKETKQKHIVKTDERKDKKDDKKESSENSKDGYGSHLDKKFTSELKKEFDEKLKIVKGKPSPERTKALIRLVKIAEQVSGHRIYTLRGALEAVDYEEPMNKAVDEGFGMVDKDGNKVDYVVLK